MTDAISRQALISSLRWFGISFKSWLPILTWTPEIGPG
jgi:hypothetical protein